MQYAQPTSVKDSRKTGFEVKLGIVSILYVIEFGIGKGNSFVATKNQNGLINQNIWRPFVFKQLRSQLLS